MYEALRAFWGFLVGKMTLSKTTADSVSEDNVQKALQALRQILVDKMTVYKRTVDSLPKEDSREEHVNEDGDAVNPDEHGGRRHRLDTDEVGVYLRSRDLARIVEDQERYIKDIAVQHSSLQISPESFLGIATKHKEIFATLVTMCAPKKMWSLFFNMSQQSLSEILMFGPTYRTQLQGIFQCSEFHAAEFQKTLSYYNAVQLRRRKSRTILDPNYSLPLLEKQNLGEGCFGPVYRVKIAGDHWYKSPQPDYVTYAMKKLKHANGNSEWNVMAHPQRGFFIQDETQVRQRNIVLAVACVKAYDATYIFYPLAECDLRHWMVEHKLPTPKERLLMAKWLRQVCDGVGYLLHSLLDRDGKPLCCFHRDIKPDNILLFENGDGLVARISDFGIATIFPCSKREKAPFVFKTTASNEIAVGLPDGKMFQIPRQYIRLPRSNERLMQMFPFLFEMPSEWEGKAPLRQCIQVPPEAAFLDQPTTPVDVEAATIWQIGGLAAFCLAWLAGGSEVFKSFEQLQVEGLHVVQIERNGSKTVQLQTEIVKRLDSMGQANPEGYLRSLRSLIGDMLECDPEKRIRLEGVLRQLETFVV